MICLLVLFDIYLSNIVRNSRRFIITWHTKGIRILFAFSLQIYLKKEKNYSDNWNRYSLASIHPHPYTHIEHLSHTLDLFDIHIKMLFSLLFKRNCTFVYILIRLKMYELCMLWKFTMSFHGSSALDDKNFIIMHIFFLLQIVLYMFVTIHRFFSRFRLKTIIAVKENVSGIQNPWIYYQKLKCWTNWKCSCVVLLKQFLQI